MRKEREREKPSPTHTQVVQVWVLLQTDSRNYRYVVWFKIILISAPFDSHFPHSQPNPPTQALPFERSLFRQFKDASRAAKIILGEYYFKMRIDSARRNEALCGCWVERRRYGGEKWHCVMSYQFQWLKEKHLVGLGSKEHKPQLRRLHELGADSLQNKRHQLCWLLTQFAWGLIQFQSRESYNDLHVQKELFAMRRARIKWKGEKRWYPSYEYITLLPLWTLYIVWLWRNPSTQGEK